MTEEKLKQWHEVKSVWYQVFKGRMPMCWERLLVGMGFSLDDCDDIAQELTDESIVIRDTEDWYIREEMPRVRASIREFVEEIPEDWARERRLEYLQQKAVEDYQYARSLEKARRTLHPSLLELEFDVSLGYGIKDINAAWKKYRSTMINYSVVNLDKVETDNSNKLSEAVIEQARAVPVESLVDSKVINAGGGRKKTLCPFHGEKTPSFMVFGDNHWHCFGCGVHGNNAVDFIMQKNEIEFPEAVKALTNV